MLKEEESTISWPTEMLCRVTAAVCVVASVLVLGGWKEEPKKPELSAPPLPPQLSHNIFEWYPDALKRAHEVGEVVIDFTLGPDGRPKEPTMPNTGQSVPAPRLIEATQKLLHGVVFQLGDGLKRELEASVLFEIEPCGILRHSSQSADYQIEICVPPLRYAETHIPEFVHWYESFERQLQKDEKRVLQEKFDRYAKALSRPVLEQDQREYRVWIGREGEQQVTAWLISRYSVKKCALTTDDSTRGHCEPFAGWQTARKVRGLVRDLKYFNGNRYECVSTDTRTPLSVDEIAVEWIHAGKRFAVLSNNPKVGNCLDKPPALIEEITSRLGWINE